jgi:short-subunit dehydrogenase
MGQTVWITGASSGIGEALAKAYTKRGDTVILSARNKEKLEALSKGLSGTSYVFPLDLEQTDTLKAIAEDVIQAAGKIDILINNGGISQRGLALDTSLSTERRIMEIDFFGTVELTRYVAKHMIENGGGKIAVTSSLVGIISSPYRTAYSAAKHALHGYFDGLRAELHDRNVQVTLLCPGFIRTDVSVNALNESGEKLNQMDDAQAKGMSPDTLAGKIIRAIERGKEEAYFGGYEVLSIYLKRFVPGIFSKILLRAKVR